MPIAPTGPGGVVLGRGGRGRLGGERGPGERPGPGGQVRGLGPGLDDQPVDCVGPCGDVVGRDDRDADLPVGDDLVLRDLRQRLLGDGHGLVGVAHHAGRGHHPQGEVLGRPGGQQRGVDAHRAAVHVQRTDPLRARVDGGLKPGRPRGHGVLGVDPGRHLLLQTVECGAVRRDRGLQPHLERPQSRRAVLRLVASGRCRAAGGVRRRGQGQHDERAHDGEHAEPAQHRTHSRLSTARRPRP